MSEMSIANVRDDKKDVLWNYLQKYLYEMTFYYNDTMNPELYFEEENVDATYEKLIALYPETEFVNLPMTHSWGQRVMRFYDPDGNLIEIGTPM